MQDNRFGKNIRHLREGLGLSQQQLAQRLFVTQKVISNWELGRSEPGLDELNRLCDYFEVPAEELLR